MTLGMGHLLGHSLPLLVGAAAIPSTMAFMLSCLLKESPKYLLINKSDRAAAIDSYRFYQGLAGGALEKAIEETLKEAEGKSSSWQLSFFAELRDCWRKVHIRRGVVLGTCAMVVGWLEAVW